MKLYQHTEREVAENEAQVLQLLPSNEWTVSLLSFYRLGQYFGLLLRPVECESRHFVPRSLDELRNYVKQLFKVGCDKITIFTGDLTTLKGLRYLHSHRIIHGDIKISNVLWNRKEGRLTIIDFGFALRLPQDQQFWDGDVGGSYPYMAPEVRYPGYDSKITFAVDVWSAGVLVSLLVRSFSHLKWTILFSHSYFQGGPSDSTRR